MSHPTFKQTTAPVLHLLNCAHTRRLWAQIFFQYANAAGCFIFQREREPIWWAKKTERKRPGEKYNHGWEKPVRWLSTWVTGSFVGSRLDVCSHYCKLNSQNLNLFSSQVSKLQVNTKHFHHLRLESQVRLHHSRQRKWWHNLPRDPQQRPPAQVVEAPEPSLTFSGSVPWEPRRDLTPVIPATPPWGAHLAKNLHFEFCKRIKRTISDRWSANLSGRPDSPICFTTS